MRSLSYFSSCQISSDADKLIKNQIPEVTGLKEYLSKFPGRVTHSKTYRSPKLYTNKKVLIVGNSASGHDIYLDFLPTVAHPIYVSRRSPARWDGPNPPPGVLWKPIITSYLPSGRIVFENGTYLEREDIDAVIYCTGYLPSYPFWNHKQNGGELYDYENTKLHRNYQHTFFQDYEGLAIVGLPKSLTFRSFEYQGILVARLWSGRAAKALPSVEEQQQWEKDRNEKVLKEGRKFHDLLWEPKSDGKKVKRSETNEWLQWLYDAAGLGGLLGEGRNPPRLSKELRWALEHVRKYPEPEEPLKEKEGDWVVVRREKKDLLHFL